MPFDLWVGDEAWDIDYFLHENPELKRAPYAWMTDFAAEIGRPVSYRPVETDGAARAAALLAELI